MKSIMRIGAPGNSTSELLLKGIIDDVRLYNRIISEDEVQQLSHYTREQTGEQSLPGYGSFDDE